MYSSVALLVELNTSFAYLDGLLASCVTSPELEIGHDRLREGNGRVPVSSDGPLDVPRRAEIQLADLAPGKRAAKLD